MPIGCSGYERVDCNTGRSVAMVTCATSSIVELVNGRRYSVLFWKSSVRIAPAWYPWTQKQLLG